MPQIKVISDPDLYPNSLLKAHEGDQGFDTYCAGSVTIEPHTWGLVSLGVRIQSLGSDWYPTLHVRSSLPKRGLMLANGIGIIDQGYTGDIKACLLNFTDKPVFIPYGAKICQLVFMPVFKEQLRPVVDFEPTERNSWGFGSSGV